MISAVVGIVLAIVSPVRAIAQSIEDPPVLSPQTPAAQIAQASSLQASQEIRAIWLDRGTIVAAGSEQGLAKVFERFKAAGINTVFVETVNAGYPIYPSSVAPEQNPLIHGWDPLQSAVDLGKAYDMQIHAWVWLFAVGNQPHNSLVGKSASFPGPVISAHPDWAGYDNHGSLLIRGAHRDEER